MSSNKQLKANRRNAQKSTGPKTEIGKARSSTNAVKHGLTSRRLLLHDEDERAYMEMRIELFNEWRPMGQWETMLVNRIAGQMWRLLRIWEIEQELIEEGRLGITGLEEGIGKAFMRGSGEGTLAFIRLARYETAIERSVLRMKAELNKARKERALREKQDAEEREY